MDFIDANIFLRYLTRDDPAKAPACFELFQKAKAGEVVLTTTEATLAEVVFVLASRNNYNMGRAEIRERLYPILTLRGFKLPNRRLYLRALDIFMAHGIEFGDAIIVAQMERQKIRRLFSYDRDFDGIPGISRHEP
jgi:uncharacterized protein